MAKFKIYSASAGAGKTYTLVKEFLRICLEGGVPSKYRNILAITFTNKAANEMKSRIVQKLEDFSDEQKAKDDSVFLELAETLEVSHTRLTYLAQATLKSILHNYSAFSVSTIDKFTNRLIRSFAQDLKLNSNYEVELDTEDLLNEAVDRMLASLNDGDDTSDVLLQFINEKLREGKSPRPEQGLREMGKNLFNEGAYPYLKLLKKVGKAGVIESAAKLRKEKTELEDSWKKQAEEILNFIDANGLKKEHFSGKYLHNFIEYVRDGVVSKWPTNATVQKVVFNGDPFYAKTKAKELAPLFDPIETELREKLHTLFSEMVEKFPRYHLMEKVLKNIYSLAVLTEIERNLQEVKEEENKLPIGEFNKLISEKLENEPTAYLFEKLGDRYQFFFIDEFQDTSVLQWQNLLPLINNAMAASGEAMIVGDAKQSIYRWRGGEVGQFIDLNNDVHPGNKVEVNGKEIELYKRASINLEYNFRSRKNVVEFNNEFFASAAGLMQQPAYEEIYNASEQKVQRQEGGYVQMKLLDYEKETFDQQQCDECLLTIEDALSRNYKLRDVAIITRKKDYLTQLAEFLLEKGINVISPDSLMLSQSAEVRAVVSFLKYLTRPDDHAQRWDFLKVVWSAPHLREKYEELHQFMADHIQLKPVELNNALAVLVEGYNYNTILEQGLLDKVYLLCRWFNLNLQSNAFLHAFLDKVSDFQNNKKGGEAEFCRYWDDKGHKQSIALPDGVDAVNLMTIHKSKGLEFPITIVPFADWLSTGEPRGSEVWINLEGHDMAGLPVAKIGLSQNANAHEDYQLLSDHNKSLVYFDNLNLAYVAFTRAVDELYVFGSSGKYKDGQNLTIYLKKFFADKEVEGSLYEIGEKGEKQAKEEKTTAEHWQDYNSVFWQDRLRITIDAPLNWRDGESSETSYGKKVHGIFAKLEKSDELHDLLKREVQRGVLSQVESSELETLVSAVLNDPEVSGYYKEGVKVLNEKDIILPDKSNLRPDRLVIDAGKVHIIDYKTGKAKERDKQQLDSYEEVLTQMGLATGDKVLIYFNANPEVVKW